MQKKKDKKSDLVKLKLTFFNSVVEMASIVA